RTGVVVSLYINTATTTTITTIWTTKWHEFFTAKTGYAIATVASLYGNDCFINKAHIANALKTLKPHILPYFKEFLDYIYMLFQDDRLFNPVMLLNSY